MLDDFLDEPTPTLIEGVPQRLILVDMSQVSISTIMATFKPKELTDFDESIPLIRHLMFSVLLEKIDKFRKDKVNHKVVLCYDNSGPKGYWRRDVYPAYKANRSKSRQDSDYNFEIIYKAMDTVKAELVQYFPFISLNVPRMEADDLIAVLTKRFAPLGSEVYILSSDGDFTQLHDLGNVKQWSAVQKKWVQPKNGTAYRDLLHKCIKGDKKDNVAPMKCLPDHYTNDESGKAPMVRAAELEGWLSDPSTIPEEYLDRFNQNMSVLDLKNIPSEHEQLINSTFDSTIPSDGKKLYSFMVKNRLSKLIEKIQRF